MPSGMEVTRRALSQERRDVLPEYNQNVSEVLGAAGFVCHCNKGYLTHWIKKQRAHDKTSVCDELD